MRLLVTLRAVTFHRSTLIRDKTYGKGVEIYYWVLWLGIYENVVNFIRTCVKCRFVASVPCEEWTQIEIDRRSLKETVTEDRY